MTLSRGCEAGGRGCLSCGQSDCAGDGPERCPSAKMVSQLRGVTAQPRADFSSPRRIGRRRLGDDDRFAQRSEGVVEMRLDPLPQPDQRDHRGNTDNDAQRGASGQDGRLEDFLAPLVKTGHGPGSRRVDIVEALVDRGRHVDDSLRPGLAQPAPDQGGPGFLAGDLPVPDRPPVPARPRRARAPEGRDGTGHAQLRGSAARHRGCCRGSGDRSDR